MRVRDEVPTTFLSAIDPDLPLDAVVLFKDTGAQLALWTRNPTPPDVVTVMASTLLASAETVFETIGDGRPRALTVETDRRRILVQRIDSQVVLALVASKAFPEGSLKDEANRLSRAVGSAMPPAREASTGMPLRASRSR
ncbi:MAG: roadblock/LC7 domain-containing protein [Methanobacteriota archaeon]